MKKSLLLLGVLLLSVSCVELRGTLQVNEAFAVKKKGGFLNLQYKNHTLKAGQYSAELKAVTSKNLKISLKGGALGDLDLPFTSEEKFEIPLNGKFHIDGSKTSQPFNVNGNISTEYTDYGYTNTVESCQIAIEERICEKVCEKTPAAGCRIVCEMRTRYIPGYKDVSYHYRRTDRSVSLEFTPMNSTAVLATLPASGSETARITDYESACR